jgi:predicted Zn-dependent protease
LFYAVRFAVPAVRCGETATAEKLAEDVVQQRPLNTLMNELYLPLLRAAIELGRNQPEKAVEFLKSAAPYERGDLGPNVEYLRGLTYLRAKKGPEAAGEFQKILDLKDLNRAPTVYPLSFVGFARAAKLSGDLPRAKKAYQDFFAFWKDADSDIPILIDAWKEYAALQ